MHKQKGQALIQTLGLVLSSLMVGVFAVDTGFYFAVQQGMRNAADAAALGAVSELFKNTSPTANDKMAAAVAMAKTLASNNMSNELDTTDVEFGYVDPITGAYDDDTFLQPSPNQAFVPTGGFNAVRVTVKAGEGEANKPVSAILSALLGFKDFNARAQAVAIYGGGVQSAGGLRPVYMCQTAWEKAKELYGDPTIPEITFYGDTLRVGTTNINQADSCGAMGPGNWGLSDFANGGGAPGNDTVRDWFTHGYNGQVNVGTDYEVQTGTPISTYDDALNTLSTNQTVIKIPLYDQTSGGGSNEIFRVSQIASFVITGYKTNGNQSQRYIRGYFKKTTCTDQCSLGNNVLSGGVTKLRLVH